MEITDTTINNTMGKEDFPSRIIAKTPDIIPPTTHNGAAIRWVFVHTSSFASVQGVFIPTK